MVELLLSNQSTERAVERIAGGPPEKRKTFTQRRYLPADVLAHAAYTVDDDLDLETCLAPWLAASMIFEDFEFVVRCNLAGSIDPFAVANGCALMMPRTDESLGQERISSALDSADSGRDCPGVTA